MKKIIIYSFEVFIVSVFLLACNFYSDKYLGANYWFWEDGNKSQIVYGDKKSPQGSISIIDANVSQYNFTDKYIIAKSNPLKKNSIDTYWIIDKEVKIKNDNSLNSELYDLELKKGLKGPLDKDSFEYLKQKLQINIELKSAF